MTSGQGQQGEPQGQPPQWQPPAPPPWQQPGPYGPPPGYGRSPMPPPGHGQPPPAQQERPITVRAGLGAFVVVVVLSVAGAVFSFLDWDDFLAELVATQPQLRDPQFQDATADLSGALAGVFLGISLFFAALYALFVWFAWRGHNWARIVLFVLGGLSMVSGLSSLATVGSSPFPSLTALSLFSFAAVVVGVVLLARRPSSEWYASEKHRRALTP